VGRALWSRRSRGPFAGLGVRLLWNACSFPACFLKQKLAIKDTRRYLIANFEIKLAARSDAQIVEGFGEGTHIEIGRHKSIALRKKQKEDISVRIPTATRYAKNETCSANSAWPKSFAH
jgi:hypothetical protein